VNKNYRKFSKANAAAEHDWRGGIVPSSSIPDERHRMGRIGQQIADTYDPDTLKLLSRAFGAAWRDIGNGQAVAAAEDRRTRLALIVFKIAQVGARDEDDIKNTACTL
jgi:hypothetical protein